MMVAHFSLFNQIDLQKNLRLNFIINLDDNTTENEPENQDEVAPAGARAVYDEFINYFRRNM